MEDESAAVSSDVDALLRSAYDAFNRRDLDAALATMTADVEWANGWEGGFVHGPDAVRDYWSRQWRALDPKVEPRSMALDGEGRVVVEVHQEVRTVGGDLLRSGTVHHAYTLRDGRVARMEILAEPELDRSDREPELFQPEPLRPEPFEVVQARLGAALEANRPGSGVDHVLVALPSYSVGESLLSHYVDRIPALEHRYLLAGLLLGRIPSCEMVFISSEAPTPEMVEYQASLLPPERCDVARRRLRLVTVPDRSARSVAAKLLDRPDLLDELRALIAGRQALIEPWNVTEAEVEVARQLGVPINGSLPDLRVVAFKSAGRRLFAEAGVPVPTGSEDVTDVDGVLAAIRTLRAVEPGVAGVVVKHDDSGAGDGNVVLRFADLPDEAALRRRLESLPEWYLDDLRHGGVVEALVTGERFTSPSAQIDLLPGGTVRVLATHEQVLGGEGGQVYLGCRFPADPAYATTLAEHADAVGRALAERGALGRASVDFAAARSAEGGWRVYALEINLRKGGTTHPYAALRNLVPGTYDADAGRWVAAADGSPRCYSSTDNVQDDGWLGRPPGDVIATVRDAGLQFDPAAGTGVVLHMLTCLAIDGRFGLTAVGRTPAEADVLHEAAIAAVRASR